MPCVCNEFLRWFYAIDVFFAEGLFFEHEFWIVGDVIITPIDTISVEKRNNASWAAFRAAHKISKKNNQSTKGNTSGLIHRRLYADVAAAPA